MPDPALQTKTPERRRVISLFLIMAGAVLLVSGVTIFILYRVALGQARGFLMETARSQARLIEAVARFDAAHSAEDDPNGASGATLSQLLDAHRRYVGFGETGELVLGKREADRIVFLYARGRHGRGIPPPIPFESQLAEPLRRALMGQSGTMVGPDYDGRTVLAAYEPVAVLQLGIVAKIDLAEMRQPFVRAAALALGLALVAVFAGGLLFLWISNPILAELRGKEQRLRLAVLDSPFPVIVYAEDGAVILLSREWTRLTGYEPDEIPTLEDWTERAYGDRKETVREGIKKLFQAGEKVHEGEFTLRTKSGEERTWDFSSAPLGRLPDGRRLVISAASDVTERKHSEEALRQSAEELREANRALADSRQAALSLMQDADRQKQRVEDALERLRVSQEELARSEARTRAIIENVVDAIITIDERGVVRSFNPAAEGMFGYADHEVLGRNVSMLMPAPYREEHDQYLRRHLETGEKRIVGTGREVSARRKDGTTFPITLGVSEMATCGPRIFTGIIRDITERKRALAELREARNAAEAANQAKSDFLASMSHELRTPLNAVIGFSEMLEDRLFGELNEKQATYVSNIATSGRHLLDLINDILDLSKVEAGKMELELSEVNVKTLLEQSLVMIREKAMRHSLSLTLEVPEELSDLEITADERKLKQILFNLLSNAAKFTPDGGSIRVECGLANAEFGIRSGESAIRNPESEIRNRALRISVRDTGIGIKPEDQERVFVEFEQVDSSYGRKQQGTGLGLPLTRQLAELHGGRVWVESEGEGKGSTFHLVIPTSPQETRIETGEFRSQRADESLSNGRQAAEAPRPSALVAMEASRSGPLVTRVEELGYAVSLATDGREALRIAIELNPAVLVLDIALPGLDGWQVLAELKSSPDTRKVPILLVSMVEGEAGVFSLGALGLLVKPIRREDLRAALETAGSVAARRIHRVLLADDDRAVLLGVSQLLETLGYEVLSAPDGAVAVDLAARERPDAAILDLMMPELSGFEVLEKLRESPETRSIPVLLHSGRVFTDQDREELTLLARRMAERNGPNMEELERMLKALT